MLIQVHHEVVCDRIPWPYAGDIGRDGERESQEIPDRNCGRRFGKGSHKKVLSGPKTENIRTWHLREAAKKFFNGPAPSPCEQLVATFFGFFSSHALQKAFS